MDGVLELRQAVGIAHPIIVRRDPQMSLLQGAGALKEIASLFLYREDTARDIKQSLADRGENTAATPLDRVGWLSPVAVAARVKLPAIATA